MNGWDRNSVELRRLAEKTVRDMAPDLIAHLRACGVSINGSFGAWVRRLREESRDIGTTGEGEASYLAALADRVCREDGL